MWSLRAAGYDTDIHGLTKLGKGHAYDEELELRAELLAYWKVAYKRICDIVPGMIDDHFVRAVADTTLNALQDDLELQSPHAMERCLEYLAEDEDTVIQRNKLKAKLRQGLEAIRKFEAGKFASEAPSIKKQDYQAPANKKQIYQPTTLPPAEQSISYAPAAEGSAPKFKPPRNLVATYSEWSRQVTTAKASMSEEAQL